MKADVKAYPKRDSTEAVKKLTLEAQSEQDAIALAMLVEAMFHGGRAKLYKLLEEMHEAIRSDQPEAAQ